MKIKYLATACAALLVTAGPVAAKPYVDYTPQKGAWRITAIEVDPNHIDDYLTGLRGSQIPAFQILKARGLMDDYKFLVRQGYNKGSPNVLIMAHLPNRALLDPDQARDEAIDKEIDAKYPPDKAKVVVAGYEKIRQFLDEGFWEEEKMAN